MFANYDRIINNEEVEIFCARVCISNIEIINKKLNHQRDF